eukprot:9857020-Karenia_brevis.AAC.1
MMTPKANILLQLADLPLESDDELHTTNLDIGDVTFIFKSALLNDFKPRRLWAKIRMLQANVSMAAEAKVVAIRQLMSHEANDEQAQILAVGSAWFGGIAQAEKVKYLFSNPKHFELLAQWAPAEKALSWTPFAMEDSTFKSMTDKEFTDASLRLLA